MINSVKDISDYIKGKDSYEILNLAVEFEYGTEKIRKNQRIANELYLRAYKLGNKTATIFLGMIFEQGKDVAIDYEKAFKYYQEGVNNDIEECYERLGILYLEGHGVEQNYEKALAYFYKGRELGDVYGCCLWLGYMHENGLGVKQNNLLALKLYQASAFKGNFWAQFQLGYMYEFGVCTKVDLVQAKYYYKLALKSVETKEKALERLKEIERQLKEC